MVLKLLLGPIQISIQMFHGLKDLDISSDISMGKSTKSGVDSQGLRLRGLAG